MGNTLEKKKRGFKMPHIMFLILGILMVMSLLTYVIPAGQFAKDPDTGKLIGDQFAFLDAQTPVNPWQALCLVLTGLQNSGLIIGMLLAAGGFSGVVLATKAIDDVVDWALWKLKDKGVDVLFPIVFFIYCFIGAFAGGDQIIAMVPIGLEFAKKLKLDPVCGMSIVLLAYHIGGMSSPTTGAMLPQLTMGVPLYSGMGVRIIILVLLSVVALVCVMRYVKKVAKDPKNSILDPSEWLADTAVNGESAVKEVELDKRSVAAVILFLLQPIAGILVVSVFKMGNGALVATMILFAIVIGLVKGFSFDQIGNSFAKGTASMAFVSFIIGCAATLSLVMTQGNIMHTIVYYACKPLQGMGTGIAAVGMSVVITFINLFIPSASAKVAVLCPHPAAYVRNAGRFPAGRCSGVPVRRQADQHHLPGPGHHRCGPGPGKGSLQQVCQVGPAQAGNSGSGRVGIPVCALRHGLELRHRLHVLHNGPHPQSAGIQKVLRQQTFC